MLLADASRYLDPSQRQVFDTLARVAMQARESEQRREMAQMQELRRIMAGHEACLQKAMRGFVR